MAVEDPSEDWEIQEYSKSEGSNNVVSWILENGLNLGKKIVITGVVISSAPLVLPLLVVISALGFAVSVPFGFVFASYACTEKLMSKLLPGSKSPLMLENGTLSKEEIEEKELGFDGDMMEEDGKYQREDMRGWDEMGTKKDSDYWQEGNENDDQERVQEIDQSVKDEGYEHDVGEYMNATEDYHGNKVTEEEEEEPRFNIADEEVKEEGYEEAVGGYSERVAHGQLEGVDMEIEGMGETKKEEPVEERSKGEQPLDEAHQVGVAVERDERNGINVTLGEELDLLKGEVVDIGGTNKDGKYLDNVVVVKKTNGDLNGSINGSKPGKVTEIIVEQRPLTHKRAEDQISSEMHEGLELEREKKRKIDSNANAREIANESGFDLFDDRNGASEKYSYVVYENPEECENTSDHTPEGNAGLLELHVRVEVPEVRDAGVESDIDTLMPVSKVTFSEDKIREQINALRTIVGYKVVPHEILVEELKALYIFTGVEPPASFKSPSDLVEVNDKLQFLMSIVGVK
ncbi:Retrotransposon-like protein [Actinidia chinensis var. chinensis]|uniref:Retrotransposon-like protein n=1 Tax=Actinidia chinensis var. chinensis TaxID=1590841 RepID=A0A2R6QAW1_ACTCC|nr:Retrotransposon-like protein [Actinidia chinensis var. chinensis]